MEKKTSIIIIIIILLVFIVGYIGFTNLSNQQNQIKIDNVIFSLPEGYHETESNNNNGINISNGFNSMILTKCDENNIQKNIKQYKESKNKDNYSIKVTNFTANDILLYKAVVVNNTGTIHYWFDYKNNTYTMYTWDGNKNTDKLVSELVESIQSN